MSGPTFVWLFSFVFVLLVVGSVILGRSARVPREPGREGYQDEAASLAYDRTSRSILFWYERRVLLRALRHAPPAGLLIDIGCGPGYLAASVSRAFPGLRVIGLDNNPHMIPIARNNRSRFHLDYALIMGDVTELPVRSHSADTVVTSLSMHHWPDAAAAFREIYRVLQPQGRFVIFDTRRDSPRLVYLAFALGQALFSPRAIRRTNGAVGSLWSGYTPGELQDLLTALPFKNVQVRRRPGWFLATGVKSG